MENYLREQTVAAELQHQLDVNVTEEIYGVLQYFILITGESVKITESI